MRLLHEAAHRAGFRFAVLDHSRDTRWRADDPGRFVISATNNHCNPLGCAIIASLLYNILAQQGILNSKETGVRLGLTSALSQPSGGAG